MSFILLERFRATAEATSKSRKEASISHFSPFCTQISYCSQRAILPVSHSIAGRGQKRCSPGVIKSASQLCSFLMHVAPVIFPIAVGSQYPQSYHLFQVFHLPPATCDLEPALEHIAVGKI